MTNAACRIIGQSRAIATLTRAMSHGSVPHAWIFHGPLGVGKFTAALEFAALLLDPAVGAEHRAAFAAPANTDAARLLSAGSHPDLHVIRKELASQSEFSVLREKKQTNIPIDLLREFMLGGVVEGKVLDGAVWRTPYRGHGKVFIIDEAELLDQYGQNALLKTLEEPPAHTYIVLVTTREDRLLPTIHSRCQRVGFVPLSPAALREWMAASKPVQDAGLDAAAMTWIERFAEGSPGLVTLAIRFGVHEFARDVASPLGQLSRGVFVGGLAGDLSKYIDECAEAIEKDNKQASVEGAKRLAAAIVLRVLGRHVRDGIERAAREGADDEAERWSALADVLADADEQIRRHLNQKHVLANLTAQWAARSPLVAGAAR
ncbi:MAG: hypothetical protein U0572_05205 [Phycisphaerales bacterium]